jgi:hypothetical protein
MAKVLSQEQLFWCRLADILVIVKSCSCLGSLGDVTTNRNADIFCLNGKGAESRAAFLVSSGRYHCDSKKAALILVPWMI